MARGRMVSKSFSTSKKQAGLFAKHGVPCPHCGGSLAEFALGLYMLLVSHADDHGRQDGDPFTLKLVVHPLSPRAEGDFTRALQALDEEQLIEWYRSDKGPVVSIVAFKDHQWGLTRPTPSKFPESPGSPGNPHASPGMQGDSVLNLTELNRTRTSNKNAAAPLRHPRRGGRREKPDVPALAAMVLKDVLPLHLLDDDLAEAAKARAATLHLPYDGFSITKAIKSAQAQARKRGVSA